MLRQNWYPSQLIFGRGRIAYQKSFIFHFVPAENMQRRESRSEKQQKKERRRKKRTHPCLYKLSNLTPAKVHTSPTPLEWLTENKAASRCVGKQYCWKITYWPPPPWNETHMDSMGRGVWFDAWHNKVFSFSLLGYSHRPEHFFGGERRDKRGELELAKPFLPPLPSIVTVCATKLASLSSHLIKLKTWAEFYMES